MDRGRLEAFSDGVFAVAITLLALDLVLPGPGHGSLTGQFGTHKFAFVAYLISFFTIGIIWVNHHAVVATIVVVNRTLLFLNLVLLFFVVLIPFATRTMALYLTAGDQDAHVATALSHVATALYGGIFVAMGLSFAAISAWTLREGRTSRSLPPLARRAAWARFAVGNLGYIIAIVLALTPTSWGIAAALALIGLVAVYYIAERSPGAPTAEP